MTYVSLKDSLNRNTITHIARIVGACYNSFDQKGFVDTAMTNLYSLELKQRVHHIIEALHLYLPKDFSETAKILERTALHWENYKTNDSYSIFTAWPVTDYVRIHGINNPLLALPLLKKLTLLFSAEFAIRPFIERYPTQTWKFLHECADSECDHVRRLASEGCRPRLPWATQLKKLIKDPAPILVLLDKIKTDNSSYVRRSVANNLNDIAKDHPKTIIDICSRWKKDTSIETSWIIRHATRTLIKKGHPDVFQLLDYTENPKVELKQLKLTNKTVFLGGKLKFSFELNSNTNNKQNLTIDYAIHYQKANGKTSPKIYKLKNLKLEGNKFAFISKIQSFKPLSTRKFYRGTHKLEILINGISKGKADFILQS